MGLFRVSGSDGGFPRLLLPGDTLVGGENILGGGIATAGNGTWTGASIITGIINRTGPTGAFTDTTDTAQNIINAAIANFGQVAPDIAVGSTFRLLVRNTVAYALTFAAGVGVLAGTGTLNIAASAVREYLVTLLNANPQFIYNCATTNGAATITFNLPPNTSGIPLLGSNGFGGGALIITPGMTVTGTGISAGTTVIGVTQGAGGTTGVTLSANATATNSAVSLTFGPTVQFDALLTASL